MKPQTRPHAPAARSEGFSLVELLATIAIMAILSTLMVASVSSVNSSLNLSAAARAITSEITTARQIALTRSQITEIRFYNYMDSISHTNQYLAIQTLSTSDGSAFTPVDKINYLPMTIMIDCSPMTSGSASALSYPFNESSTALNPAPFTPNGSVNGLSTTGAPPLPNSVGMNYTYRSLRFKVGGGIDYLMPASAPAGWPPPSWYITVYDKKYASAGSKAAIHNFITVDVDSLTGRVQTFQP
ncbi:MAG: prepilin-type N-terminal cleavage/methylation domain-containing protein [Verrucomicrobiota bacterium]